MIKRADFMFTVGYEGSAAIVDGKARKRYGSLSVPELLDMGQYKAAFAAALYDGDDATLDSVRQSYNAAYGTRYESIAEMKRLFGIDRVREDVERTKVL